MTDPIIQTTGKLYLVPAPLDFGIGYRHRANESTLMVFTRKSGTLVEPNLESVKAKPPLRALPVPEEDPLQSTQ